MSDLHNESIFITGGGSGLGLALVERFIEEGAQVATLELSAAKVASLRQRFGEHILAVEGNVTCYADYQRAVDQILTRSGKLDCFIGNAGIWDHNASLVNTPAETLETGFHELFNVNVLGYLLGAKACAPALIASEGSMIFTLSNAAWYQSDRSLCLYDAVTPGLSGPSSQSRPSHCRSSTKPSANCGRQRSGSRSSIRSTIVPPSLRISSQASSAVQALPRCIRPEGLGAKRPRGF